MSGILGNILSALGLGKDKDEKTAAKDKMSGSTQPGGMDVSRYTTKKEAAKPVDVAAIMEAKAKANPQELNWKESIVDLLKLLGIDSDQQNRKELASELGAPLDLFDDSAKLNVWLHKKVMQKIAENGGKVPANLLD
jgi:hypothetical protein